MTKGHRTIVALLAAVAVLLGLNLLTPSRVSRPRRQHPTGWWQ